MPLTIVKATEPMPVENITLTIYAAPGLGKSTLAFTAEKPLMLDFDKGAYRAGNRKDTVTVLKWEDVESMNADDLEPYSTIIVDTAGRALDVMSNSIIAGNPKMGKGSGALSLQGFGELKSRFSRWKSLISSYGKDIVLICHMTEEKNGDDIVERIDAQGASKNEIYKSSDAMCRIVVEANGQRALNFDPREGGFGKNPAQLPKLVFPHPNKNPVFLAEVIAQIKGSINKMTTEQGAALREAEEMGTALIEATTLDELNVVLGLAKERGHSAVLMVAAEAKKRGYRADKATGLYVAAA